MRGVLASLLQDPRSSLDSVVAQARVDETVPPMPVGEETWQRQGRSNEAHFQSVARYGTAFPMTPYPRALAARSAP